MNEITFTVTREEEERGFCARWDDPSGGGIATQGDDLAELQAMIGDAVEGYFEAKETAAPRTVRLHFVVDPVLEVAAL